MAVSYPSVSSGASGSGEAHGAGGAGLPYVLVGPAEVLTETPVAGLDDEARWFGAGGLAVRPPSTRRTSARAAGSSGVVGL